MLRSAQFGTLACTLLGPVLLSGCGAPPKPAMTSSASLAAAPVHLVPPALAPEAALPAAPKPAHLFTLDTPVDRIAADPHGKAILDRDVPGLLANKEYPLFDDMSLSEIAIMSHGRLGKDRLNLVQSDLVQLSDLSP